MHGEAIRWCICRATPAGLCAFPARQAGQAVVVQLWRGRLVGGVLYLWEQLQYDMAGGIPTQDIAGDYRVLVHRPRRPSTSLWRNARVEQRRVDNVVGQGLQ